MNIKEILDEQTRLLNEEKKHKNKKSSYWCSDAGKCPRKVYYAFKNKNEAEEFEPRILRVFQNGDDVHDRICRYLDKAGVLEATETEIPKNDYNITGRIDALLKDGTIVEIKSINVKSMNKPIPEHVGQLQLYLFLFGNTINGKRKGVLLYESKQTQESFVFEYELDMDMVNKILSDFKEIQKCLEEEEIPERKKGYYKSKYPCKYCNYKNLCYKK